MLSSGVLSLAYARESMSSAPMTTGANPSSADSSVRSDVAVESPVAVERKSSCRCSNRTRCTSPNRSQEGAPIASPSRQGLSASPAGADWANAGAGARLQSANAPSTAAEKLPPHVIIDGRVMPSGPPRPVPPNSGRRNRESRSSDETFPKRGIRHRDERLTSCRARPRQQVFGRVRQPHRERRRGAPIAFTGVHVKAGSVRARPPGGPLRRVAGSPSRRRGDMPRSSPGRA